MSALLEKINKASIEARKARDSVRAGVLGMVLTDVTNLTKAPGRNGAPVTDEDVMGIVKGWVKKTNDAIEMTRKGNGDVSKMEAEKVVLMEFLPKQLSNDELAAIIAKAVAAQPEKSMKAMGAVMKVLNTEYSGQFDGKVASEMVKKALA